MNRLLIAILLFTLSMGGCRKAPPLGKCGCMLEVCTPIPPSESAFGYQYTTSGTQYNTPCFNPNNYDEFIYFSDYNIVKYTISTQEKEIIAEDVRVGSQFSWSRQGWIVFHDWVKGGIWKIRDDGTELQKIYEPPYNGCSFNFSGDKIIIATSSISATYPPKILNTTGTVDTTLSGSINNTPLGWRSMPWNKNNEIILEIGTKEQYGSGQTHLKS